MFDPAAKEIAYIAEGWHIKNFGGEARKPDGNELYLHVNGSRGVFMSSDHARSFSFSSYESRDGYRQVYGMSALPPSSVHSGDTASASGVVIGAHAGVYIGSWSGESIEWKRATDPAGTASGLADTVSRTGGCRGAAASPDGAFVYAVFVLNSDSSLRGVDSDRNDLIGSAEAAKCTNTTLSAVFVARTADLVASSSSSSSSPSDPWVRVSSGLDELPCVDWAFIGMDPRSTATHHRLALGIVDGARAGLLMADMKVDSSLSSTEERAVPSGAWYVAGSGFDAGFNMTQGWEYRSWKPFAFDFFPLSWNSNLKADEPTALVAGGGMNLMRSQMDQPGWPKGPLSWINVYTHEPSQVNVQSSVGSKQMLRGGHDATHVDGVDATVALGSDSKSKLWAANGFTSTYVYDMAASKNYAVSCQADHGIVESFDGGRAWTQFNYPTELWPSAPTRCAASVITPAIDLPAGAPGGGNGSVPVVLLHGGTGYGASGDHGCLLAKPLIESSIDDKPYRIAGGHNSFERTCEMRIAGLPNKNFPAITLDPNNPKRVIVSTEGCGMYIAEDFTQLMLPTPPASANFTLIQATNMDLSEAYFSEVVFVPERNAILASWTSKKSTEAGLWELIKLSNGSYSGTQLPYAGEKGLSSWQVKAGSTASTRVVYPGPGATGVQLSTDGGSTFTPVLSAADALKMREGQVPWYNASLHEDDIIFSAGAGDGDSVMVACWVTGGWNKAIGVFKGTIQQGVYDAAC